MKKFIHVFFCTLIIFACTSVFATEEISFATGEWPPYTSETMQGNGLITEIVTAVVHEMGMVPKYTFYPWKRAEEMVMKGKVFAAFPYAQTVERKKYYDFSDRFTPTGDFKIFYNRRNFSGKPSWETKEDLKPFRIGAVSGFWYIEGMKEADLQLEVVATVEQNFKMLHTGRIDITMVEEYLGWWYVKKLYPDEISNFATFEKSYAKSTAGGGLIISRNYPDSDALRVRFNEALAKIKESGIFQEIIDKYGVPNRTSNK